MNGHYVNIHGRAYRTRLIDGFVYYQFHSFEYPVSVERMLADEHLDIFTRWDLPAVV